MKKFSKYHYGNGNGIFKLLMIMKLTLLLFFLPLLSLSATSYSQGEKISLEVKDVSLKEILKEIEGQSNYRFIYKDELVRDEIGYSLHFKKENISDILDKILDKSNVDFSILEDNLVVLVPKGIIKKQTITVKGTIKDIKGYPLPGVNVVEQGTTNGTVTDLDGNYSIDISSPGAILSFSYVGYLTEDIEVGNQNIINVTLIEDIQTLDEVVVVGYGTMKKTDLTGSVASVKGEDLTKVSASSVSTAIAGRLPGLQVTQATGDPGSSSILRIRGVGSVYSGVDPLVLIDGFQGSLSQVSPSDVESVTVLKDAASASIYGAMAANGVILVTTKKGKIGQPLKLELTAKYGIQQPTNIPEILDSEEWCRKMNEATMASSGIEYWTGAQAPELQTTNTNWLEYIFRDDAPVQDYHLSASGGTENLRYSVNLGYFDQDGIMINRNYKKYNIRSNLEYSSKRFTAGLNIYKMQSWNKDNTNYYIFTDAFLAPPTIPLYNSDGLPGTPREGYQGEDVLQNPTPTMDAISRQYELQSKYSVANLFAEIEFIDGLKFKTVFNASTTDTYDEEFFPEWYSYRPDDTEHETVFMGNSTAELEVSSSTYYSWETQNLLTYTKDLNKHHINLLAGISAQKSKSASLFASKTGFPRNSLVSLNAGSENQSISGSSGESSLYSQFGRANYSYSDKYLLQFNIRRDGSSTFAPEHRWGIFPSISVGWRISEEGFMQSLNFIDNLKLRAGIGSLGNTSIPSNQWFSSVSFYGDYVFGATQSQSSGAALSGAYNENISWETTTTTNIGFDLQMNKGMFDISFEVFKRNTTDMLLVLPLPTTTGYSSNPYVNIGGVDNIGWEFSGTYRNNMGALRYDVSFNLTHVENEVVDMGGVSPIIETYTRTQEGEAINSYYGYVVEGIYQSESDIENNPSFDGAHPGDFKYKDLDNDGDIDEEDREFLGNAIPQFYYGGNINLAWKNFDLGLFFQGEFNKKIMMTPEFGMDFGVLYDYTNMFKEVYDNRWTQEGDDSYYPAIGSGDRGINNACNTRWIQNASYLRLKNIQLGYTLPTKITSKIKVDNLRIFLTATNLLTITDYIGFDPEMGTRQKRTDGTSLYMDQVYTRGGCDIPQAKTMQVGVNINF